MKFSPFCIPRPPDTTTRAAVSSGRSDLESSAPRKLDSPDSPAPATASVAAPPPSAAAGPNPVMRTVMTLMASVLCTVAMALPA